MGIFDFFRKRSLRDALNETKRIKIEGVYFTIRKLNPLDFLSGSEVLLESYNTYEAERQKGNAKIDKKAEKTIYDHYRHTFMAGVVKPVLTLKQEKEGIYVDNIFNNSTLMEKLYQEIMGFTYGKKKIQKALSDRS